MKQVKYTRVRNKIETITIETDIDEYGRWEQYFYNQTGEQIQPLTYGTYFSSKEELERSERYHEKCRKALAKIKY